MPSWVLAGPKPLPVRGQNPVEAIKKHLYARKIYTYINF